MIPTVYDATGQTYIGALTEAESVNCVWSLDGQYDLQIEYLTTGAIYNQMECGQIVYAVPYHNGQPEPFEISEIKETIDGRVTILADHISYRLKHAYLSNYSGNTATALLSAISSACAGNPIISNFTFSSTVIKTEQIDIAGPSDAYSLLRGALTETYGGEVWCNGYTVLHRTAAECATDRGAIIRYGYNATDFSVVKSRSNSYNAIIPYYAADDVVVMGDIVSLQPLTDRQLVNDYTRPLLVDFTEHFSATPTAAQLEAAAADAFRANDEMDVWRGSVTADLSYIDLSRTLDYCDIIQGGEDIRPGDTVTLIVGREGNYGGNGYLAIKRRIVGTDYNVMEDRYNTLSFSNPTETQVGDGTFGAAAGLNSDGTPVTAADLLSQIGDYGDYGGGSGGGNDFVLKDRTPIYASDGTTVRGSIGTQSYRARGDRNPGGGFNKGTKWSCVGYVLGPDSDGDNPKNGGMLLRPPATSTVETDYAVVLKAPGYSSAQTYDWESPVMTLHRNYVEIDHPYHLDATSTYASAYGHNAIFAGSVNNGLSSYTGQQVNLCSYMRSGTAESKAEICLGSTRANVSGTTKPKSHIYVKSPNDIVISAATIKIGAPPDGSLPVEEAFLTMSYGTASSINDTTMISVNAPLTTTYTVVSRQQLIQDDDNLITQKTATIPAGWNDILSNVKVTKRVQGIPGVQLGTVRVGITGQDLTQAKSDAGVTDLDLVHYVGGYAAVDYRELTALLVLKIQQLEQRLTAAGV